MNSKKERMKQNSQEFDAIDRMERRRLARARGSHGPFSPRGRSTMSESLPPGSGVAQRGREREEYWLRNPTIVRCPRRRLPPLNLSLLNPALQASPRPRRSGGGRRRRGTDRRSRALRRPLPRSSFSRSKPLSLRPRLRCRCCRCLFGNNTSENSSSSSSSAASPPARSAARPSPRRTRRRHPRTFRRALHRRCRRTTGEVAIKRGEREKL